MRAVNGRIAQDSSRGTVQNGIFIGASGVAGDIVGTASRVPRVTLALACSEGLYTLSHPVASSLIHIQHQPEHHIYLQLTVPLCYQQICYILLRGYFCPLTR
jgi:hypothetical protein